MKLFHKILVAASVCCSINASAQLTVTPNKTASQLANALVGAGVTVSNATLNCPSSANGTFTSAVSPLSIANGIILATGNASSASLTSGNFADNDLGAVGDADLQALVNVATHDRCVLEFDFVAQADAIKFDYQFGSEEYPGYSCSNFNDVFGFFISGPGFATPTNIALLPIPGNVPVTINTTTNMGNTGCNPYPKTFFINNTGTGARPVYDGLTTKLSAEANITMGATYHLKLGIADVNDGIYDSGVFLEEGSLTVLPPVITGCPADITSICGSAITWVPPTATSGNLTVTTTATHTPGFAFPPGTTPVTYTFDNGFSQSTCTFNVTVVPDNVAPTPDVANLPTISGECSAGVSAPTATDNCVGAVTGTTSDPTSYNTQGTYTVNWTYDDGHGNTSTQVQTVIVNDATPPVPDVVSLPTVTEECNATVSAPTATDNCVGTVTGTTTDPTSYTNQGTYTVNWTYSDGHGNTSTQAQTVVINDVTPPVAICKNYTLDLTNGTGTITPQDIDNGSYDNCGNVILTASPVTFTCADAGDNFVTLTADDGHGNTTNCIATVTVQYQPTCTTSVTPANSIYTGGVPNNIYLGYGPQSATITTTATGGSGFTYSWSPTTDLSDATISNPVFAPAAAGNYTYTVTATNSNGCSTTCTVSFCVKDIRVYGKNGNSNGKVYICHVPSGNSGNPNTLSISTNAVATHLSGHPGDHLGICGDVCGGGMMKLSGSTGEIIHDEEMELVVYPNPFKNEFTIRIESNAFDRAEVTVYDITGRIAQRKLNQDTNTNIVLGTDLAQGVYIIEVKNGTTVKKVKMVKE
ncbi:MAG TPA: choice-of-anchor L domain-containing protein [Flavipsychrobacter sp.]|jgi:hypothetical protein|nr:choice-of-anchor L domain-containing protein [Flavipsychrobacter sp.]